MSAKNKLKITIELLKQFVETPGIASIQLKNKFKDDIENLIKFTEDVPLVDDNDYQTEKMSLIILNETVQTVINKWNQFYQCEKQTKKYYQSDNIQSIKNKQMGKEQLSKQMTTLLFEDINKDVLREKNINQFFQQMQIKIKDNKKI